MSQRTFMMLAGEASGDALAAELVHALKETDSGLEFFGAGGSKMHAAGVEVDIDLTEHAVIGIWEALRNYSKFKGFFDRLLDAAAARRPEAIILVDNPGFNLRFAAALRDRALTVSGWNPRIIQYISPQLWAWNESRVYGIARDIDLLLSIFPFEKAWYAERAPWLNVEFVGHPLVDRHPNPHGADTDGEPTLLILPGSREKEITRHLPVMVGAVRRLSRKMDFSVRMVLPSEKLAVIAKAIAPEVADWELQTGDLSSALEGATSAIASSGTVTMECAWFRVPTVVLYKTSWPTYLLGRCFIKVPHIAMPNVLAGGELFPEFIQGAATAENLAMASRGFLQNPGHANDLRSSLDEVAATLGEKGASNRAARAVLKCLESV
ncbi:MAG: lipid-A-disaccharide synthase [Verrucomicrobiales bacterium]|nr:lipid-A-disaccharide synthase [Verrucomicrobiales bacterium]|tara:strand:+ start:35569 stop:36708 length:1140 start_codon:yes stop_codon:yes gene_type:complete